MTLLLVSESGKLEAQTTLQELPITIRLRCLVHGAISGPLSHCDSRGEQWAETAGLQNLTYHLFGPFQKKLANPKLNLQSHYLGLTGPCCSARDASVVTFMTARQLLCCSGPGPLAFACEYRTCACLRACALSPHCSLSYLIQNSV